jgi:hypothetical protein
VSINKFQEKIFRTGCGSAVLFVCAGVFFAGMFYMGCGTGARVSEQNEPQDQKVAIEIGDYPIYANDLTQQIEARRQQAIQQGQGGSGPDALPPKEEAYLQSGIIDQSIQGVGYAYLAHKEGVQFTDDAIRKEKQKDFDESLMMAKMQVSQQMKLKGDPTDKQLDAFLKSKGQPSLAEIKNQFKQNLESTLKDAKARGTLESTVAQALLRDTLQSRLKPTDAQLKAGYDNYDFKRILFSTDAGADVSAQVGKAQADLKAGLTFEQAMDRYSKDPPMKGKKVSDGDTKMMVTELDSMPAYAPLKLLKPGQVSDVIDTPMGKAIFKLIGITNSPPPDLLKNKATYVQQYASRIVNDEINKNIKALVKSSAVKWHSPGFKAIYDWMQVSNDARPTDGAAAVAAKFEPIVAEAKKAYTSNEGYDGRAALLAWYAASDAIWSAKDADKAKLRADRIELLKTLTADTPYFSLKLEIVDLEMDAKQGPEAAAMLQGAAASNYSYDAEGLKNFQDINARMLKLRAFGMLTPAAEKSIQASQDAWKKNNADVEAQKEKLKEAQDEEKKKDDALKAEQMAEAAKAKADADKKAKSAAPTSSAAPSKAAPGGTTAVVPPTAPPAAPPAGTSPAKKK